MAIQSHKKLYTVFLCLSHRILFIGFFPEVLSQIQASPFIINKPARLKKQVVLFKKILRLKKVASFSIERIQRLLK